MAIRIVADSVSDIPVSYREKYNIEIIPLSVNFDDDSYEDGIDLTSEEFFEKLQDSNSLPTTSQVTVGKFMECFDEIINSGDEAIVILMSSKMSGTYNAALLAKEQLNITDQIRVIDSKAISFGYGLLVIEAARMVENNKKIDAIEQVICEKREKLEHKFIVDTLEYLHKGGRLPAHKAFVGNLLNIKPIVTIKDGELVLEKSIRGRKKAMKYIVGWLDEQSVDLSDKTVAFFHAVDEKNMNVLKSKIENNYDIGEIIISNVGTVVGTHSGPGCVAMSFIND